MSARAGFWRRRGRIVAAAVVVAVAAGTIFVVTRPDDDVDPRAGSELLDAEPGLFDFRDPPESYRIDYRVEGFGSGRVVATADRLLVRRPFESRLESFHRPGVDDGPSSVQVSAFGSFAVRNASSERVVVAAPPSPGVSDVRLAASLADALEDERFELGERRRIIGRECQVIRTAVGLSSGDLEPPRSATEYADTCIDADGLVLEEVLYDGGAPLLRRVAVDVELGVDLDDDLFETGEPSLPTDEGGGFFAQLVPGSRPPGTFYEVMEAPARFDHRGRFAVVPTQAELFDDDSREAERLTFVSDVYVDGPDVIVLDQGGTLGGVDPFGDVGGVEVDVDVVGAEDAVLTYGQGGPIVIVRLGDGRFLRARTTTSPDVLLDLLAALEPVEGGELELVETSD